MVYCVRYGWRGVRPFVAVVTDDIKREQKENLYRMYMTKVIRDIANASYYGKYDFESYTQLAKRLDDSRVQSSTQPTKQEIINHLLEKL